MKRTYKWIFIVLFSFVSGLFAQENLKTRAVQLSVIPPLTTDRIGGSSFVNYLAIGLPVERSGELKGAALGLFNFSDQNTTGLQLGLWNRTGLIMIGAQIGGFASVSKIRMIGWQYAVVNVADGSGGIGWQLGFINKAGFSFTGLQSGGSFNISHNFIGFQLSSFLNLIKGERGLGFQLSFMNFAFHKFTGFQLGVYNQAGELHGVQIGGWNIADKANGLQIGMYNYSKKGHVIPLGIINIFPGGVNRLQITLDSQTFINIDWHVGWKYIHKIFSLNYKVTSAGLAFQPTTWGIGVGLSVLIPVSKAFEIRAQGTYNMDSSLSIYPPFVDSKLYVSYTVSHGLRLIGGIDDKYFPPLFSSYNILTLAVNNYFAVFAGIELNLGSIEEIKQ